MTKIKEILEKIEKIEDLSEKIKFIELMIVSLEQKGVDKNLRKKLQDMLSNLEEFDEVKKEDISVKEDTSIDIPKREVNEENLENTVAKERTIERTEERLDNKYQSTSLYQNETRDIGVDTTLLHKIEEGLQRYDLLPGDRIFNSEHIKGITHYMENMGLSQKQVTNFTEKITGFSLKYEAKDIKGTKDIRMFKDYEV
ncbi:MAG: hypothetical protein WC413_01905 [Candidatus Nanoarchaeia archaeon]